MYLGIDIGGTKTLLAVFDTSGELIKSAKFPTSPNYETFKSDLNIHFQDIQSEFGEFKFCCCAVPGKLNLQTGLALAFGNLEWVNIPIQQDIQKIISPAPAIIENDAKLAGLSEAKLVQEKYKKVLYLTISTGIGGGVIINGIIDPDLEDFEPGWMALNHNGKMEIWEHFASGKAIVAKYGKRASEIDDPKVWKTIVKDFAVGMIDLIATIEPEVIIIGGGVGAHFKKFGRLLQEELESYNKIVGRMVNIPPVIGAKHPEEAVIYGCYELIRQTLAKTNS